MEKIQLLHNSKIDLDKWDNVITNSANTRVYAESWYLDIIEPDWLGLIYGDYEYLMPLVSEKKWGICYLYQPTYVQQHGIFPPSTPAITQEIIDLLKQKYNYFNISLNVLNLVKDKSLKVFQRENYILSLKPNYIELKKAYNGHAKRYTSKAAKLCDFSSHVNFDEYLKLKEGNSHAGFSRGNLMKLKLILSKSISTQRGKIYGAYSKKNELIAAAFFIYEQKRVTYLNSVSTPEGKENRAMYGIVNKFIEDYSESSYLLDFEGSNLDGIARFFAGFGASPEIYQHIQHNNLPWFLKILKR